MLSSKWLSIPELRFVYKRIKGDARVKNGTRTNGVWNGIEVLWFLKGFHKKKEKNLFDEQTSWIFTTVLFVTDINHVTQYILWYWWLTPLYHSEIINIFKFSQGHFRFKFTYDLELNLKDFKSKDTRLIIYKRSEYPFKHVKC